LKAISKKIYKGGSAELKNRNAAKQRGGVLSNFSKMAIFEKFENAPGISPNKKSPTCVKFLDFLNSFGD
jgi:hypothetical protein